MSDGYRTAPPSREWRVAGIIFFSLIALLILYGAFRIIWGFITPVMLGAIIVTVTFPTFMRVRKRVHGRQALAASLMLVGITFLLIIPILIIVMLIVQQ